MSNTCIRVLADPVQIKECKEAIQSLEEPLADVTKVFNLARNAARLKILYLLSREGEMCPCDFSDILEIVFCCYYFFDGCCCCCYPSNSKNRYFYFAELTHDEFCNGEFPELDF